jgi:Super-infection exclusion protein B
VHLVGLFSLCYLPTRPILEHVVQWEQNSRKRKRLSCLTKKEKEILSIFVSENLRSFCFERQDAEVVGLVRNGVLFCPMEEFDGLGRRICNIEDWALIYLKKHSELIKE